MLGHGGARVAQAAADGGEAPAWSSPQSGASLVTDRGWPWPPQADAFAGLLVNRRARVGRVPGGGPVAQKSVQMPPLPSRAAWPTLRIIALCRQVQLPLPSRRPSSLIR